LSIIAGIGPIEAYPTFKAAKPSASSSPFGTSKVKFNKTHTLCRVIEGKIKFTVSRNGVDGQEEVDVLTAGEAVHVPKGTPFKYEIQSAYARMYVFSGRGGGLEEVFVGTGRKAGKGEVVGDVLEETLQVSKVEKALQAVSGEIV
jgi:hypothetical protein